MKLHFGHGIVLVMALFMGGILLLVYKTGQQRVDLVSKNYYDQELKYEGQIEKERKSLQLRDDVKINYDEVNGLINVKYPVLKDNSPLSGTVTFYKPDNASLDYSLAVKPGNENIQSIKTTDMANGLWKIKVNWDSDSVSYYKEEKISISNQ
jgi:nitrogen fixation protein FixH